MSGHEHHERHEPPHAHRGDGEHAPAAPAGHDKHAGHSVEMFRDRFWITLALTIPIVVFSETIQDWFGYTLPDFPGDGLVAPVLGTIVFVYGGRVFLEGAWHELRARQPGMMMLISLAITVAYVASLASAVGLIDIELWWELATLITIMLLGHWVEMKAIGQARGALASLAELLPDEAERVTDDGLETVPIAALAAGDLVLVRPGARVPADGRIEEGRAELDESMVTGESKPVPKEEGDRVVAGTVVLGSALRVRVEAVGEETTLAGIQRLVEEAQQSRSRSQVLADRFAAVLFYVAVAAAAVTFLVWAALGDVDAAIERTVTVLVIACPHALGLAVPLVIAVSTSLAARQGILVKDRLALERMRTVDTVLFDKTGTLTLGRHAVSEVASLDGDGDAVLVLAAAAEADSEHPVARAIVAAATERGAVPHARDFRALPRPWCRGGRRRDAGRGWRPGAPARARRRAARGAE